MIYGMIILVLIKMATYQSKRSGEIYHVTPDSCTCADFKFRKSKVGGRCKHMIELFYPALKGHYAREEQEKELKHFEQGLEPEIAYELFGDTKIKVWLTTGEICKHRKDKDKEQKFYRLM